jgi:hypothetical protein
LIFIVYWVPISKVIKTSIYPSHFIQSIPEFPAVTNNSKIITPQSLVGLSHMGNHRKAENVFRNDIIGRFLRLYWILGQRFRFLKITQLCSAQKMQQSGRLQNCITPKLLIISGNINNSWKYEKVFYNSFNYILFRFQPH